jgi:hypothetical protein
MTRKPLTLVATIAAVTLVLAASQTSAQPPATTTTAKPVVAATTPTPIPPSSQRAPYEGQPAPEGIETERARIWNSPDMLKARQWIADNGRLSRRVTTQQTNQYLSRLQGMSPEQMQDWLKRFKAHQAAIARGHAIDVAARRTAIGQALVRQDARRQAFENINSGQTAAAMTQRFSLANQQEFAQEVVDSRAAYRTDAVATMFAGDDYRWLNLNHNAFAAAAAMVPGDLPAGDPANFIRGDTVPVGDAAIDANSK